MGKPEVVQGKCCRPFGNRPEPPRTMAIESALPTTDRGCEANEGLRVGLRIRRIPPSRRLNSWFSRTEEIIINRPLDVVLDAEAKTSLKRTIDTQHFVAWCFRDTQADRRRLRAAWFASTHLPYRRSYAHRGSTGKCAGQELSANSATSFGITPAKKAVRLVRTDLGSGRTRIPVRSRTFQLKRKRLLGVLPSVLALLPASHLRIISAYSRSRKATRKRKSHIRPRSPGKRRRFS